MRAVAEVQESVRYAIASGKALRIRGAGGWLDAKRRVAAADHIVMREYAGVVDYVPGDLTITVRAGTSLREIATAAGAHSQWLPIDAYGSEDSTIGAIIATGSWGPLATGFGRVRDLLLGVEFVGGDGNVIRAGGRVVKNVAGYDLCRLLTGSWGTLGPITEVTLRLYAAQPADVSVAIQLPATASALEKLLAAIRSAAILPWSFELVDEHASAELGFGSGNCLLVRFGGNTEVVQSQLEAIRRVTASTDVPSSVWGKLQHLAAQSAPENISMRIVDLPSRLMPAWKAAGEIASACGGFRTATVERGAVRIHAEKCVDAAGFQNAIASAIRELPQAKIIFDSLPVSLWNQLSPSEISDGISAGIKTKFDPHNIFNPGILGS